MRSLLLASNASHHLHCFYLIFLSISLPPYLDLYCSSILLDEVLLSFYNCVGLPLHFMLGINNRTRRSRSCLLRLIPGVVASFWLFEASLYLAVTDLCRSYRVQGAQSLLATLLISLSFFAFVLRVVIIVFVFHVGVLAFVPRRGCCSYSAVEFATLRFVGAL